MVIKYLIHVRNIPWTVSQLDLQRHFAAFGAIKQARVVFNKFGFSTGYGFVEFYDKTAMNRALCAKHILEEKKLFVRRENTLQENANHFVTRSIKREYMQNPITEGDIQEAYSDSNQSNKCNSYDNK